MPLSPEEWAERFLTAILPFYAPVVAYSTSLVMLFVCVGLVWNVQRQRRTLQKMASAQEDSNSASEALASRYDDLNARLQISIDEHALHRAKSQAQFDALIEVQERFFGQPVVTVGPRQVATGREENSNVEAPTVPQDGSEPSSQ